MDGPSSTAAAENEAQAILAALNKVLACQAVKVRAAIDSGKPGDSPGLKLTSGTSDLRSRRTVVTWSLPADESRYLKALTEPGEVDDSFVDAGDDIFEGGSHRLVTGKKTTVLARGRVRGPRRLEDPTWILEALPGVTDARCVATHDCRGEEWREYEVRVDLRRADRVAPARRVRRPHWLGARYVRAHVWLDASGDIRRTSWKPVREKWLPLQNPAADLWHTTELWDFEPPD